MARDAKQPEATAAEDSAVPHPDWLAELERRVHEAAAEIGRLRQETRRLERELARLRRKGSEPDPAAGWQRERAEVQARVERLVAHLEGLLGPSEPPSPAP